MEVGEAVEELAAEEVEVAVAIEVGEVRAGPAEDVDGRPAGLEFYGLVRILAGVVFDQVDPAVERSVLPAALAVVGVVPLVVAPVADADDEVLVAVAVPIDVAPHAGADFAGVDVCRGVDLFGLVEAAVVETDVFEVLVEDAGLAVDVADLDVVVGFADVDAGFEDRHFDLRILGGVFEEVEAVGGFVRAGDDEVEVAVAVVVHRERPRPEADAEIDLEAGVVVFEGEELPVVCLGGNSCCQACGYGE